jgi:hypothetical protein
MSIIWLVIWFARFDITIEDGMPLYLWLAVADLLIGAAVWIGSV